ncbi:sigma-70 family RNA polymerase sigma factor [Candidatus Poribacteria bacterium]|nr:sigma-70 family RNA polymerase sigma factor [Candidatus Poribacteria bacterium]
MGLASNEPSNLSDEELINRIQKGDKESFDKLVRDYFPKINKKVRALVPPEDADDVTQDVLLNLVKSIDKFKGKSAFATWLNRIVSNRVADYYRKVFRQRNRFIIEEEIIKQEPAEEVNNNIEMEDLLMKLPENYREVILMKLCHNLSFAEIASELGVTYEAARSRYRRGIKCAASKIDSDLLLTHN